MSLTPSTMLALGSKAPDFNLLNVVTGEFISLDNFSGKKILLIIFMCRHCPYVQHVQHEIAKIGKDYQEKDIGIVAISSNDTDLYPDDNPESLKQMAKELGFDFPYLYDETQEVAKAYTAACTPDIFLFDKNRELVYRGQLDDSRPENNIPVAGKDVRGTIDNALDDKEVSQNQKPSMGCNIKWKPGNEPSYFSFH